MQKGRLSVPYLISFCIRIAFLGGKFEILVEGLEAAFHLLIGSMKLFFAIFEQFEGT